MSTRAQRPPIPAAIRRCVLLLFLSVTPGVIDLIRGNLPPAAGAPSWFGPVVGGFSVAVVLAVALLIRSGRSWARWLYVVLFVLGVPLMLSVASNLAEWPHTQPFRAVLLILQFVAQLVALVLLFVPEANAWFRTAKLARKSA